MENVIQFNNGSEVKFLPEASTAGLTAGVYEGLSVGDQMHLFGDKLAYENPNAFSDVADSIEPTSIASEEEVQTLTDQLLAQQGNIKPEKAAEMVFQAYFPKFSMLASSLNNKDLKRLVIALCGYPLEISVADTRFHSQEAKEAFSIGIILQDAKFVLTQKALSEKLDELEKAENVDTSGT
jgi:hypothetical protein